MPKPAVYFRSQRSVRLSAMTLNGEAEPRVAGSIVQDTLLVEVNGG